MTHQYYNNKRSKKMCKFHKIELQNDKHITNIICIIPFYSKWTVYFNRILIWIQLRYSTWVPTITIERAREFCREERGLVVLWRQHDESDTPRNTRNCDRDHNTRTNDLIKMMHFNPWNVPNFMVLWIYRVQWSHEY